MLRKLIVNSRDRTSNSTSSSDFVVQLPYDPHVKAASLLSAYIPEFYNVTTSNNVIDFVEDVGPVAAVVILPGAYSVATLMAAVGAAMTAGSPNARTYTATFDTTSNFVTLSISAGSFNVLPVSGAFASTSLLPLLGFPADTTLAASQTATIFLDIARPNYLLLHINEFGVFVDSTSVTDRGTFVVDLSMDPSQGPHALLQLDAYKQRILARERQRLTHLTVKLLRPGGQVVDLGGLDWSFALELETVCGRVCNCSG